MGEGIVTGDGSVTALAHPDGGGATGDGSPLAPGTVLAARYEVLGLLGRGGMGVVVRAYDRTLGEEVAVKLLRLELAGDRRWAERLAREVKLARQIHHPNVCRVFDFVQTDGHVFIVMELAVRTLRDELSAEGWHERPKEERLADARAVTAGLAAIHRAGIVHRDVTTQNVLRMADGRLILSDFGLAMDVDETTASVQGGTVPYMAPELALGGRATPASDIWALGIVVHEIVFGRRPSWRGNSIDRGMERPAGKLVAVEAGVVEICRACTAATAGARPPDAATILARLEAAGGLRRRRRSRRVAVAFVVLALAAAGWVGARQIRRMSRVSGQSAPVAAADKPIELTGTAEDWTTSSRVLTKVADRIHCLTVLPDRRTVRYVWGAPKKVEDVDIATGERRTPALVPTAYAEGCPELSPAGKEMIFQGYDKDGRAGIFRSMNADGSDAGFVVPAADPSYLSEPKWLAGGRAFIYDADRRHFGVLDRDGGRPLILPESGDDTFAIIRSVCGASVYVTYTKGGLDLGLDEMAWPTFEIVRRPSFRGTGGVWSSSDCRIFHSPGIDGTVVEVDMSGLTARRIGIVKGRHPWFVAAGAGGDLIFATSVRSSDVWHVDAKDRLRRRTHEGHVVAYGICGGDELLVERESGPGLREVDRVGPDGSLHFLHNGGAPLCSRAGTDWWYVDYSGQQLVTYRCHGTTCDAIMHGSRMPRALSPDESRLAYVSYGAVAVRIGWMPSHGGPLHDVVDSETICEPGWSSNTTLWVSRRKRGRVIWTEVNADSGVETGRVTPGAKDCADGEPDPLSPVDPEYRLVFEHESEIRVKGRPW